MALSNVTTPYDTFTDTKGKIISFGRVYIGAAGQDPETNPITCYWDSAGTIVAAQPLQIVNGYIVNTGTPAQVFTDSDYSIRVYDTPSNSVVYYYPNILAKSLSGAAGGDLEGSYPNPTIKPSAITTVKIADNAVSNAKLIAGGSSTLKGTLTSVVEDINAYSINGILDRVGELIYYAHVAWNTNLYAWCNGATLSRTTDARLFAKVSGLIGTQGALGWGAGDGSTTFTLPDYRNYFMRGYNTGVLGAFQLDAFQNHGHSGSVALRQTSAGGNFFASSDGTGSAFSTTVSLTTTIAAGSGTPRTDVETRPINFSAYICVVR